MYNAQTSTFAGMTVAQAQAALSNINQAIINLGTGVSPGDVSYTQGESSKRVTYRNLDLGQLNALKADCVAYLAYLGAITGASCRRRAIGVLG